MNVPPVFKPSPAVIVIVELLTSLANAFTWSEPDTTPLGRIACTLPVVTVPIVTIELSPAYVPPATLPNVELNACTSVPITKPKFVLAVDAFDKSDKLLDFANFVPTVVTKLASEPESFANEAESSPSVSNVESAVPIKSVSSCCT